MNSERAGDWDSVASYVESGGQIDNHEIRAAIARILRAKNRRKTRAPIAKRGRRRPRSRGTEHGSLQRTSHVLALTLMGEKPARAKELVARSSGKTLRQVQDDVRLYGSRCKPLFFVCCASLLTLCIGAEN